MSIELIWAQDYNGGIGKKGKLPWHIPEDLINFKKITTGHPIIMGRKTWDSLPFKPLPGRPNIVLSSRKINNIEVYNSVDDCLKMVNKKMPPKIFIIGGQSVYESFFQKASVLHLTLVNQKIENIDTFFPVSLKEIEKKFNKIQNVYISKKATYSRWEPINKNPLS